MGRVLGVAAIYALMFIAWAAAGLFMLFAPIRCGNLIHDSFGLYPEVRRTDWGKKLVVRIAGMGLLVFAVHLALRIAGPSR